MIKVWGKDIVIAQTNAIQTDFTSASPIIDFGGATLDYSNSDLYRDHDEDGWSTYDELQRETDPFNADSYPPGTPPPPLPLPPNNLRVAPGDGQLSLQWDVVEGAEGYYVYFGTASDLSVRQYLEQGGTRLFTQTNSQILTGLGNGTTYFVLVTTAKGQLESKAAKVADKPVEMTNSFLARVNVTGLNGALILTLTHGIVTEDLTVTGDGRAVFPTLLPSGTAFSVTIKQQPVNQTCKVGTASVNESIPVEVKCDKLEYAVIANVNGLGASGLLELQNGNSGAISVQADRLVTVDPAVPDGSRYHVTVKTQPPNRQCTLLNGTGTVGTSDVRVEVLCSEIPTPGVRVGGTVVNLKGTLILSYTINDVAVDEKFIGENGL